MSFQDILVYADGHGPAAVRLDFAAALAGKTSSRLTALHASPPPFVPAAPGPVAAMALRLQADYRHAAAAMAKKAVDDAICRSGTAIEWRQVQADPTAALTVLGRCADLAILGQGGGSATERVDLIPEPEDAVLRLSCPAIVVPRNATWPWIAKRIVVAWKDTREAARAVHDALPLLQSAEAVTIVEVVPEASEQALGPGSDLALHLARHGVNIEIESVVGGDASASDIISAALHRRGADLLVMGAYGHSRMREVVLGGMTRQMLRTAPVPLFLSH